MNYLNKNIVNGMLDLFEYGMYDRRVIEGKDIFGNFYTTFCLMPNESITINVIIKKITLEAIVFDHRDGKILGSVIEKKTYKRINYFINYVNKLYEKYN